MTNLKYDLDNNKDRLKRDSTNLVQVKENLIRKSNNLSILKEDSLRLENYIEIDKLYIIKIKNDISRIGKDLKNNDANIIKTFVSDFRSDTTGVRNFAGDYL